MRTPGRSRSGLKTPGGSRSGQAEERAPGRVAPTRSRNGQAETRRGRATGSVALPPLPRPTPREPHGDVSRGPVAGGNRLPRHPRQVKGNNNGSLRRGGAKIGPDGRTEGEAGLGNPTLVVSCRKRCNRPGLLKELPYTRYCRAVQE